MKIAVWAAACLSGIAAVAASQQVQQASSQDTGNHVVMSWEEFKQITGWEGPRSDEGTFTVPWEDVQDLFGIEVKNMQAAEMKLPWKDFKALLEWSVREEERKKNEKLNDAPAPTPYLITSSEYIGSELSKEGAQFKVLFKIDILAKKGWQKIKVLPGTVAISKADLPDGVFLQLANNEYYLLTQQSGEIEATLEFSTQVTETGGSYTLAFNKVPSGTCLVDVTVPQKDVDIKIHGAQSRLSKTVDDATHTVAALAANSSVNISWERAIPEVAEVPPKLYAQNRTLISVSDGMLTGRSQLSFNILHAGTRQILLNVPADASIFDVQGSSIRDWRVSNNQLLVQFSRDMIGSLAIEIRYEAPIKSEGAPLPVITAQEVEREKGHIAIVALTNVEVSGLKSTGATEVDTKDLPPELLGMTSQPVLLGYRYVDPGFDIKLQIDKHPDVDVLLTVVDNAHFTVMQTLDGRRIVKARYNVRNNRNQFLRLMLPDGASLWSASVAGKSSQPAKDEEGRLLLPLVRSQGLGGRSSFPVEITYAENGKAPDAKGRGTANVVLVSCSEPVTHMMVDLYVPEQGRYDDFEGSLRKVDAFTDVATQNAKIKLVEVQRYPQNYDVDTGQRTAPVVRQPGADSAIEVQLPITGTNYKFEKILVLDEDVWLTYTYSRLN